MNSATRSIVRLAGLVAAAAALSAVGIALWFVHGPGGGQFISWVE